MRADDFVCIWPFMIDAMTKKQDEMNMDNTESLIKINEEKSIISDLQLNTSGRACSHAFFTLIYLLMR